ncbi:hypothetical protein FRX31_028340 [Thalictrum thalictroides]|uniref:Uncharacterized protein n=1 Tax=Thalictrum thalictroides TaxID=46969 RepID=A0A7J6VCX4_THATH|nr:hypothetical protein FRX31_028340 [Thalictrum thalictroides]
MDLSSCLLLVLLIYGRTILQTSYVGKGYVTALSKEIITDDNNHILGDFDSSNGICHDEVSLKRSSRFTAPSPPIFNKGRNWVIAPPPFQPDQAPPPFQPIQAPPPSSY